MRLTIIQRLLPTEYVIRDDTNGRPNVEETFYCLLMRYRQKRLENYRVDPSANSQNMMKPTSSTLKPRKTGRYSSLTNKPGVVIPQPNNKPQPPRPAKPQFPTAATTVSQKKELLEQKSNPSNLPYPSIIPSADSQPFKTPQYPTSSVRAKDNHQENVPPMPVMETKPR
jgi:hypothetical protein